MISILKKYEPDSRAIIPYWFILGEIYEKEVKDYEKAITYYKAIIDAFSTAKNSHDREEAIMANWYRDWINFLIEHINVLKLRQQKSFTHRTLKYPNVEYGFFMSFGASLLGFATESFIDEDFLNYGEESNIETFDRLYNKYPNTYRMMFFGIALYQHFLKENIMDNAILILERLIKLYPDDINTVMLQLELANIYKKQNIEQKYKEARDKALSMAKSLNVDIILGPDPRFLSPEKTWQLFVESLKKGDIDSVIECFSPTSQQKYREVFTALKDHLDEIASAMGKIRKVKREEDRAEYEIIRVENGQRISYGIYFIDIFGEWKIEQF